MYNKIFNPVTHTSYPVESLMGQKLLRHLLQSYFYNKGSTGTSVLQKGGENVFIMSGNIQTHSIFETKLIEVGIGPDRRVVEAKNYIRDVWLSQHDSHKEIKLPFFEKHNMNRLIQEGVHSSRLRIGRRWMIPVGQVGLKMFKIEGGERHILTFAKFHFVDINTSNLRSKQIANMTILFQVFKGFNISPTAEPTAEKQTYRGAMDGISKKNLYDSLFGFTVAENSVYVVFTHPIYMIKFKEINTLATINDDREDAIMDSKGIKIIHSEDTFLAFLSTIGIEIHDQEISTNANGTQKDYRAGKDFRFTLTEKSQLRHTLHQHDDFILTVHTKKGVSNDVSFRTHVTVHIPTLHKMPDGTHGVETTASHEPIVVYHAAENYSQLQEKQKDNVKEFHNRIIESQFARLLV